MRLPGTTGLAGSSLCLDDGVRNLVRWGIASFEQAVEMASTRLLVALAPALRARNITLPHAEIDWSDSMAIRSVRVGDEIRNCN